MISYESFESALRFLIEAKEHYQQNLSDLLLRDGLIQRFEYTYELAWKTLIRFLEADVGQENIDSLTRRELYRIALEKGLISEVTAWFRYHDALNQTLHTYNQDVAEEVYRIALEFIKDAEFLLSKLKERYAS